MLSTETDARMDSDIKLHILFDSKLLSSTNQQRVGRHFGGVVNAWAC
jgi:hypothetical protein